MATYYVSSGVTSTGMGLSLNQIDNIYVLTGGELNNTNLYNRDDVFVSSGGRTNNIAIYSGGVLAISSGALAKSTTVEEDGQLRVSSGGTATDIVAYEGAGFYFDIAPDTYIVGTSDGYSFEIKDGLVSNFQMENSCFFVVSSGTVKNTTVNSNCRLCVSSGGIADGITINSGGSIYVSGDGTATNIIANNGARLDFYITPDTYITGTVGGSSFEIQNGVISNYTTENGYLYISSGITASNTTINGPNTELYVFSGGIADKITVNNGRLSVYSGGTATNIVWTPCEGHITVENGATVTFASQYSGIYWGSDSHLVSQVATMNNATVNPNEEIYVMSNGTANSNSINSKGKMEVFSGGIANRTNVNSGGQLNISSGGTAISTFLYGSQIAYGAVAGILNVSNGGVANSTVVNAGGYVNICSGGTAYNTVISGQRASGHIDSGGVVSNIIVGSIGTLELNSGGTANTISVRAGVLYLYSGATATNVAWTPCDGLVYIEDGAYVTFTSQYSGTYLGGSDGLISHATVIESQIIRGGGGEMQVMSGGTANSITVKYDGYLHVSSGGTAINTVLYESVSYWGASGPRCIVCSGGIAINTTVSNGQLVVSGGTLDGATIEGGSLVFSQGTATNVSAKAGAKLDLFVAPDVYFVGKSAGRRISISDGNISDYTIADGSLNILSGGIANNTSVTNGTLAIRNGGSANQTTILNPGLLSVYRGGTANNTIISGGQLSLGGIASNTTQSGGSWFIGYGGIATKTEISGGSAFVEGTVDDVIVNSGGRLFVSSGYGYWEDEFYDDAKKGGVAKNITVNSGGSVIVSSGGSVAGRITLQKGALFSLDTNATLNFDLTQTTAGAVALVNNLSLVQGTPTYTITVAENGQEFGTFILAEGVNNTFNGTISVQNESGTIGELIIGSIVRLNEIDYKLMLTNNTLKIRINEQDLTAPTINISANLTTPTNQDVTVTAAFADNVELASALYKVGNGEWVDYEHGITVSENTTIYFRAIDDSGNESEASYSVTNIDKEKPTLSYVKANITKPTNENVTITALFEDNVGVISTQYRIGETGEWTDYQTGGVTVTENATVFFRATDAANNQSEASYSVTNIDKVPPETPVVSADIIVPTNKDVVVTATFSEDTTIKEYSLNGVKWVTYSDGITFQENGTVWFRGWDEAGNVSDESSYIVDNIDKIPPEKPDVSADITTPTRGIVTLTATFSEDSVSNEYSLDGLNWGTYVGPVYIFVNGPAYFRSKDAVGNISEIATYEVSNIDTTPPEKPTATADITSPTNKTVTVSAIFSEDTAVKEYSFDNWTWSQYKDGVEFQDNDVVYFRGSDEAGNISEVERYVVNNIDKIAPVKPTAVANITDPTNKDVIVTATFSEDSTKKEYSLDGDNWQNYTTGVTLDQNGTVYFRGWDEAGNVSDATAYTVDNIDKTPPQKPGISADITAITNKDVVVSATFSDDSVGKEFSLDFGQTWEVYTGAITFVKNGTVKFRAIDDVGNISDIASYTVANIDKTPPQKPSVSANITAVTNKDVIVTATFSEDSIKKEYSLDGDNWQNYTTSVTLDQNGTVYFRGWDEAGNVSDVTAYKVDNIDKIAPVVEKASLTQGLTDYTFTATVTASDDTTAMNQLVYYVRYSDSADTISSANAVSGLRFTLTSEESGKTKYYQVGVADKAGNVIWTNEKPFMVADRIAPVLNGQPTATFANRSVSVTWDEATDNLSVAGYRLILNNVVYELQTPGYVLKDAEAGNYTYQVIAYDAAGNETASEQNTLKVEPRADLTIRSMILLKNDRIVTTVSMQDTVALSIQIDNIGDALAKATAAHIYCGDVHLGVIAVAGIEAGDTADAIYTLPAGSMSTGIQEICIVLDANEKIEEYSELNNEKTLKVNVVNLSKSDLVIGTIGLEQAVCSVDEDVKLTFTVRNIGYAFAGATKAFIYDGDTSLGSVNVDVLEADSESVPLTYTIEAGQLSAGNHVLRVVANGDKAVSETNQENNSAQVQLTVGRPDLSISKLALSRDSINTEEDVTVSFTVRNGGVTLAPTSLVGIYDGKILLGMVNIDELSGGLSSSKQFTIAAGILDAGDHNLRVVADYNYAVKESDETNNERSIILPVSQKDDIAPEFNAISIAQDAEYGFTITAVASDNITPASELAYGFRFARTIEDLETAVIHQSGMSFGLTSEDAGATMYYQVSATDLAGNMAWSIVKEFTVADHTAPEVGNISVSTADSVLTLGWEATDNIGISLYKFYFDDALIATQTEAIYTMQGVSSGTHTYRIEAIDAAGNIGSTDTLNVNIDDTEAPVISSVLAVQSDDGSYGIKIIVNATDNETPSSKLTNRVQYAFLAEDVESASFGGLYFALNPEDAGKTLYYRISVSDESGNTSWSNIQSMTIRDTSAPDIPTDLTNAVNGFDVTLNWTASIDNVGVAGYLVRYGMNESLSDEGIVVSDTSLTLNNLKDGFYYWQTAAVDAAGNISDWSEEKRFRVLPEDIFGLSNTPENAWSLGTLSGEQTLTGGVIGAANDADWFKFTLNSKGTANDYVQLTFDGKEGDLDLYLYASNGTTLLVSSANTSGSIERISLKDLTKGTYLLKVVGKNGAMNTFNISTRKVAGYDMDIYDANSRNDSIEAATIFDVEKTPQSSIPGLNMHESGDVDIYQFTLSSMGLSGDSVSISFENSVGDLDLHLLDSRGSIIAASAGTGNTELISFNGMAAGTYYIQVSAAYNAVNEYTLNWNFASNKVEADELEGQEPYAFTESHELTNLSISAVANGVTQEDVFQLVLDQPGSASSKIRFSNYRSDWNGMKYVVTDSNDAIVLSGIGSEISLDGLEAGKYNLTVDTPVAGSFSSYDISVSLPESTETKWTYMVYMAADSNLDTYALYDLISMQQATLDSQIDIYVLVDRSATSAYELSSLATKNKWDSAWSDTRVGKITYNPGSTVSVDWESWGELDTSSITTLKMFVDWVQGESKAENYGLIMWDHGTEDGSLCVDGTTDADWGTAISISDVSAFLSDKGNIPLVIFNNCLLGSEIVATQMVGSTDVIVVSEAESHPQNSTYAYKKFFSTVTADMNAQEMAKVLVQNVQQYGDGTQPSMLSAVDVTNSKLATALEKLAVAVSAGNNNDKTVLINGMAKTLQDGCAYAGSTVYQSDLYNMIVQAMADRRYANTSDGFKTALADLKSVLEDIVLSSKSVPANRGYGIATFNPVLTVKTYAASGYSTKKVSELIQAYLEANYAANPAWAGLLSDLAKTYQTQYSSAIKTASFSVSSIIDIGRDELISSMDLGCFSGQGEIIDGINLLGDIYLGVTITSEATSSGRFTLANDVGTDVSITIIAEDGSPAASGLNAVSFSNLAVGDYIIILNGVDDCTVTLSFEADWMTGVDRFDFAQSKTNEKFANGNGSIAKASSLAAGYYSGLLTYQSDTDWYQIGNIYTEKYRIELGGAEGLTVAEYDAEGNLIQTAKFADGVYTMTMKSMNYLFVEGNADLNQNQVNAYSVSISSIQSGIDDTPVSEVAPQTQKWEKNEDTTQYIVEYSTDNFEHVIQISVDSNSLDSFQMPANYQMRVKAEGGEWSVIEPVDATETATEPKLIISNGDGTTDVFFANSIGTWEAGYVAQHVGSTEDSWGGTKEYATLFGKNKLADIIEGSTDANILLMTDDANGDGLFVDDIYSALPGSVTEQQARIAQIDEIRAGAGNDIVDMTSQRFAYTGTDLTIRGGAGNDVIWANKGDNKLFGDAGNDRIVGASGKDIIAGGIGNDRMHGGGGEDIFTFGENWGMDTVEQLEGGKVTLWFASGSEANWNAETLTYTDGSNSVKVTGVNEVSLMFGKGTTQEDEDQFATLSSIGAFADFTSERIFEESGKGILASL